MTKSLKNNVLAGFSVFLLALPLSLGIAIASNFPPVAGVLSAIVGGMVASWFGGAQLSIKGPAAALIVIVLGAVNELGGGDLLLGYQRALAVGVVAAIIQIFLGMIKKAEIAEIIPPSVIHGMLAAIGIIIISKQLYIMLGLTPENLAPIKLLIELPRETIHLNPIIFGFGILAFVIAVVWPLLKKISVIPSTIIILATVIPLSVYFNLNVEHSYEFMSNTYMLGPNFLIDLPGNFLESITLPDFSFILNPISIKYIILFTLIGSIESLLTVCAVDSLAPRSAPSNLNKDLCAVGIGNLVSSFIGGLPMISEIIRSKANIDYGATSSLSNFFHGLFMLMAIIFFSSIINLIPLSALAALLVFIGLRLASPKELIHAYRIGIDQLFILLATLFTTLLVDLLVGIMVGISLKLVIFIIRGNSLTQLFKPNITIKNLEDHCLIQVQGALTFFNYLILKKTIKKCENKNIIIDLDSVTYIDYTVAKKLETLCNEFKGVKINLEENQQLAHFYDHPISKTKGFSINDD